MSDNVGRNELCSCGSGKKYKKCCFLQESARTDVLDFAWHQLRQTEGIVIDNHLIPFVTSRLHPDIMVIACDEFFPEELAEALDSELIFNNFFIPWFLFNWIPFESIILEKFDAEETIAHNYLVAHSNRLTNSEKRFIEAMEQTYYSFYCVLEVHYETALIVKDILLGTQHTIKEKQGTYTLKRGDIIFSRILSLDGQSIFIGMAPYTLPAGQHTDLLDFRSWLIAENENQALNSKVLRNELSFYLFEYFFTDLNNAYNQPLPILVNTDNELIEFSKSYFKLELSPEETLNRLLPLSLSNDANEFLQDADYDQTGEIKCIELPWFKKSNKKNKSCDNTILGIIKVEPNRLILETNSQERTAKGKKLLTKYLGDKIHFQRTLIEIPEQKFKSEAEATNKSLLSDEIDIKQLPEVHEKLKEMTKAHWADWFDIPIPALKNQTPREAAKTTAGRERLEALLLQYENYDAKRKENDFFKVDINSLKKELGLV